MGMSVNGYIAKPDGNSEWTSKEDLEGFYNHSKKAGNIVMGKNTFLSAQKYGYFPFPNSLNIVVSNQNIKNKWGEKVLITSKSPKDIVAMLEEKGFSVVFLAGGGQINSSFIKEGLIDEIYLDVEPLVFGQGIQVFAPADFEFELKLLEVNKLNTDTVQLHYKIIK